MSQGTLKIPSVHNPGPNSLWAASAGSRSPHHLEARFPEKILGIWSAEEWIQQMSAKLQNRDRILVEIF